MEALRLAQTPAPDNPKPSLLNRAARTLPGIIAGAADLDPAAVLTATVAGASYGTSLGWVVLFCIPILQSVFGVAARIGHETKLGLIKLIREHFGARTAVTIACMVAVVN